MPQYEKIGLALNLENWDQLNDTIKKIGSDIDNVGKVAFDSVVDQAKLDWKPPVPNFSSLSTTYLNALEGYAVQTLDDDKVYRFDGESWIYIQSYGQGPVTALVDDLEESKRYAGQADFVDMVRNMTGYKRVRFRKRLGNKYEVSVDNGNKHVTYGFLKDTNDDFIKLGKSYVGALGTAYSSRAYAGNLTGTWNTASPPHLYTTVANSTFSAALRGTKFLFAHRSDNRGGVWEFVVDGNTANKVMVSTWAAVDSGSTPILTEIFSGLADASHTIVGTFKGADPLNAPTGGTARGWVWSKSDDTSLAPTFQGYLNDQPIEEAQLLTEASNKEIVFNLKYGSVNHWVPEHDGISVAFNATPTKFILDDVAIDVAALASDEWVECTGFRLVQSQKIRFPEAPGVDLMEWDVTHSIGMDGVVSVNGYAKALEDVRQNIIYALMLPVVYSKLNEVLTSIGNGKVSANDGIDYYFPQETDSIQSGCFISASNPNYIVAGKINFPLKTMRIGKPEKPATPLRFWQRTNDPKLYFQAAENWNMEAGDTYSWSNKIAIGKIDNIYRYAKG